MALDYKSSLSRYRRYLQSVQSQSLWVASMWMALSLVLLIVLIVLALRPTLVTISSLLGQVKQQTEISNKLDGKILSLRKALDLLETVRNKIPLLMTALPKETEWETLAQEVDGIARETGVTVVSITVDKISETTDEILPVKFTLTGNGSYEQIRSMVVNMEKMGRLVILRNVTITQNKNEGLGFVIDGEAGYLPEPKM